ncbi:MAG: hypothetical protein ABSF77_07480 [Spirochaetia bacterium]|jgi:hypothetical protein
MRCVAEEGTMNAARPSRRLHRRCALAAAGASLLLLASCATVPQRAPSEWLGVLPEHATLYASFAVTGSADLVKKALKDAGPGFQDVSSLLDMTKRLVCSVTIVKGSPASFSVVALGSYPSGVIGMRLGGNKDWKRASGPAGKYWQWNKAGIQMSIPNNGILLAANGGIDGLLTRWTSPLPLTVPPDVASDMQNADLVLYMPELPGGLAANAAQKGMRIPIQEVWMNAVKGKAGYDLFGTANTGSEQEAKLLTLALRLGIVAWMRSQNVTDVAGRLKSITVTAIGVQVKLAGLHLSDDEIIPLFLSLVKGLSPAEEAPAEEISPTEATPDSSASAP